MQRSVDPQDLDTGTLALFVGFAAAALAQDQLSAEGFGDLRFSHGYVFQHLVDAQPTIGELAAGLDMTQQGASKAVAELEQLGYTERIPDPRDPASAACSSPLADGKAVQASRRARAALEERIEQRSGERLLAEHREMLAQLLDELGGTASRADQRRAAAPLNLPQDPGQTAPPLRVTFTRQPPFSLCAGDLHAHAAPRSVVKLSPSSERGVRQRRVDRAVRARPGAGCPSTTLTGPYVEARSLRTQYIARPSAQPAVVALGVADLHRQRFVLAGAYHCQASVARAAPADGSPAGAGCARWSPCRTGTQLDVLPAEPAELPLLPAEEVGGESELAAHEVPVADVGVPVGLAGATGRW